VVDSEWEEQMWKAAWAPREVPAEEECVGDTSSSKRKDALAGSKKRIKLDKVAGVSWGEAGTVEEEERSKFLYTDASPPLDVPCRQSTIKLLSGQEWLCNMILRELLSSVVEMVSLVDGSELWEEWEQKQSETEERSKRDAKEESWLWKMLDECDAQQAKEDKVKIKKQKRRIEQARKKMHTGKDQPSMMDILKSMQGKDTRKEESRVNTQTASQRNIVKSHSQERSSVTTQTASQRNIVTSPSQVEKSCHAATAIKVPEPVSQTDEKEINPSVAQPSHSKEGESTNLDATDDVVSSSASKDVMSAVQPTDDVSLCASKDVMCTIQSEVCNDASKDVVSTNQSDECGLRMNASKDVMNAVQHEPSPIMSIQTECDSAGSVVIGEE
jgi:hypothetical protein